MKSMRIDTAFAKQKQRQQVKAPKDAPASSSVPPQQKTEALSSFSAVLAHPAPALAPPKPKQKPRLPPDAPRVDRSDLIGWEDIDDVEIILRKFDMDPQYGPCAGLSRLDRWRRAKSLGMDPPQYILDLLTCGSDTVEAPEQESLWHHV